MVCACCLSPSAVHVLCILVAVYGLGLVLRKWPRVYAGSALAFSILLATDYSSDLRDAQFAWLCGMISKGNSLDALRCGAVGDARGRVLEFGAGPGTNFKCWKRSERITEWVGVDPNEKFKPLLEASKVEHEIAFPTSTVWLQGEDVDVEPHSFDYIIGTHVLCSVTNKTQVLQQMVRALRPGGKIIFFEHTLAPTGNGDGEFTSTDGARVRWWQELIAPIFFVLGRGCTFSEIWVDLETLQDHYGMDLDLRHVKAPHNLPIFQPHVVGSARMPFTELEPESEPESESESETRAEQEQEQEQEREHRTDRDEKST